ncbi:MAG: hypothetical protein U9N30_02620 [Campylobacterota bacterium]|nr:hypothetical protein [Campylobacterota bacterium]
MDAQLLCEVLGYSSIFNYTLLIVWFAVFTLAKHWIYNFHTRWFKIAPQDFDAIHYKLMGQYKLLIFVFNLGPFFALCMVL